MARSRNRSLPRTTSEAVEQLDVVFVPDERIPAPPIDAEAFARVKAWVGSLTHYLNYAGDGGDSYVFRLIEEIDEHLKALSAGDHNVYFMAPALVGRPYARIRPLRGIRPPDDVA